MLFNIIKSVKSLWDTITHTEIKQLVRLSDEQGSGSHHQTPTFFDQQIGQKFDEIVLPEFTTDTNAPSTIGLDRQILSGLAWLNKGLQGLASTLLKFAAEHPSQVCILLGLGALTYNLVEAAPGDTVIDVANNRTGIDVGNGICWAIPRIYYAVGQYNCSLSVLATNGQPGIFTLPLSVVTRVNHPNVFLSTLKTMLIPLYAAYSRPILFIGQVSLGLTGTINHLTAYGCYSNYYQVVTTLNGVSKTEAFNLDVCIINIPPYSDPHTVTTHASLLVGSNELNGFTAIDPDGDDLTYTGTLDDKRMPSGWFINPANNQVTILINRDDPIRQVSNHSYLSTADDHFGGIVSARMAITIINRAPFYTQHYTDADNPPGVKRGQRLVINLRSNYEDPEGDQVTTFVPAPWALPAGTVLDPQFSLTIAPIGLAPRGPHLVYFSLMDSLGMRSIAQEPITITYDNWDPVIKSPSAIVIPPVGTENWCTNIWALNLDPLCTDADFDPLTLMLSGGPNDPQLHFNNGTLCIPRITPLALETSEASTMTQQGILWCVDRPDGGLPGSSARVPVTFRRTNSAPVIEGGLTTLHLALNGTGVRAISLPGGSDPDGQPLSWSTRSMGYQMTLSNDQIVVNIGLVDLNTLIQGTALLSDGFGGVAPLRILATPRSQPLLSTLSGAIESFTASSDLQQVFTIGPGAITSPDGTQVTYTLSIDNYPSTPTASGWCRIDAGALGLSAQVYCSSPLTRQITIHIAALEGIPHQPGRLDVDKIVEFIPAPIITIPFDFSNSKYAPAVAGLGGSVAFVLLLLIIKRNWDAQNTHSRIVNLTKVDQWRKELHHMALLLKSDASEDLFHTIQEEEGSYESDSEEEETALTFIESVTRLIQALDSFQDALSSDIEKGGRKPTEFLAQKTYHLRQSYEDILIKFQHLIDHQDDDPMSHSNYMTLLTNLEETIKAVALNIKTLLKSSKLLTSQGLLPIVSRAYIYFTRYYATLCPTKDIYTLLDLESLITDYVAVIQANVESYHENSEVDLLFEQLDALINLALLYHSATPDVMAQIVPFNRLEVFYCCAPQQIPLKTIPSSVYNSLLSALTRIKNKTETLNAHKINHVASASLNALTHLSESSKTSFFGCS